ncbi:MAG: class I SAM-dependent methyltransferase [Candidatus Omnitrophica bacterium]|nr:class I SAM-dependent methyltransferase [Candidatus Omnitrophota bacterium]
MNNHPEINAALRDEIIRRNPFREQVFGIIPQGAERILDFGCHEGELLFRLARDKACRQLYGVDIDPSIRVPLADLLDGFWNINLAAPDADLGAEFSGFFRYIVMHDVVEHLYDPWYVCAKLRRCLAADGRLIIVTPNVQNWQILVQIVRGYFPYGAAGGIMNEDHIRWFTLQGLQEMLALSGYSAEQLHLIFPPGAETLEKILPAGQQCLRLPPEPFRTPDMVSLEIRFPDAAEACRNYPLFLANKILAVCRPTGWAVSPEPVRPGALAGRRQRYRVQCGAGGTADGRIGIS